MLRMLIVFGAVALLGCELILQPDPYFLGYREDYVRHLRDENPTVEAELLDIATMTAVREVSYEKYIRTKSQIEKGFGKSQAEAERLLSQERHGDFVYFIDDELREFPMVGGGVHQIYIIHRMKARIPK